MHTVATNAQSAMRLLACAAAVCLLTPALAAPPTPTANPIKDLLTRALKSPAGAASGSLQGPPAEYLRTQFATQAPVNITVTTLHRYAQAGCSRLRVRFSQEGVVLPGEGVAKRQFVQVDLNYCLDGKPPRDLAAKE